MPHSVVDVRRVRRKNLYSIILDITNYCKVRHNFDCFWHELSWYFSGLKIRKFSSNTATSLWRWRYILRHEKKPFSDKTDICESKTLTLKEFPNKNWNHGIDLITSWQKIKHSEIQFCWSPCWYSGRCQTWSRRHRCCKHSSVAVVTLNSWPTFSPYLYNRVNSELTCEQTTTTMIMN